VSTHKHRPILGDRRPRFAGLTTFMRLPHVTDPSQVDIAIVGVPWDASTVNRPGARHAPRQVREMSGWMRLIHPTSGIAPYELCSVADYGDVPVNPLNLQETMGAITEAIRHISASGAAPLVVGGDHLTTLPVLRGLAPKEGPLGVIHFDAHSDTMDEIYGDKYNHATPFRRAVEEKLIDPRRTVQIGIRGSHYEPEPHRWALEQGFRIITIEEFYDLGIAKVIAEARRTLGAGPAYISFDVDGLDPSYAPGTGTPEVGGFTTLEAMRVIRGLEGLDIRGADIVEVSPPFDTNNSTALVAATLLFEILCVAAKAHAERQTRVPSANPD
jgi:guanidinopropionase